MYLVFYDSYPDVNNAEREMLLRLERACENINIQFVTITNQNVVNYPPTLVGMPVMKLQGVLCIISLHFSSPKTTTIPTYYVLWNPLSFYTHYNFSIMSKFDGYISCYGKMDSVTEQLFNVPIIGHLNTSICEPIYPLPEEPDYSDAKCFYIGINWEITAPEFRQPRTKVMDIVKQLEMKNIIDIYGPQLFHGIDVWNGYESYRGEIPFDGKSVVDKIHETGICLVLSSDSHNDDGIVSNRIFEGLAAGVPLICNENPFIKKWFGDNVFYVKSINGIIASMEINKHVKYIRTNPKKVLKKVRNCREIFMDKFVLDKQLSELVDNIKQHRGLNKTANVPMDVSMNTTNSTTNVTTNIRRQIRMFY